MPAEQKFVAAVLIERIPDLAGSLKRLALFCDEIRFFLPSFAVIRSEVMEDPKRVTLHEDRTIEINGFNYFRDASRSWEFTLESFLERLGSGADRETLEALVSAGVAKEIDERALSDDQRERIEKVRELLVSSDVRDEKFNAISETKPEHYGQRIPLTRLTLAIGEQAHDAPRELNIWTFEEPNAVVDSYELTQSLLVAESCGYSPVFPLERHRRELEHRYAQYQQGLRIYAQHTGEEVPSVPFEWKFAECAYLLSNTMFTSDLIEKKSILEIIRYREALKETRRRFVTENLFELTEMIEETPWSQKAHDDIDGYVLRKLSPDLSRYQDESQEIWEKLFGSLTVHLTSVAGSAAVGSAGFGILGSVIPGTSAWGLLALGALAGAAKEAPKVVESLVNFVVGVRKQERNSIAYLAKFK
jgi:hypothetical protein